MVLLVLVAFLFLPFLPAVNNTLRSRDLEQRLTSTDLPSGARVINSFGRVYNGGNGDGCDYQALAVISYMGEVSMLREAFLSTLEQDAARIPNAKILTDNAMNDAVWWAKTWGGFTEMSIRPNTDHSPLYLVTLNYTPRNISFDFRCM